MEDIGTDRTYPARFKDKSLVWFSMSKSSSVISANCETTSLRFQPGTEDKSRAAGRVFEYVPHLAHSDGRPTGS
jgi:hypothetical protein